MSRPPARVAVAVHDVAPATFARCVEVRGWLAELGLDRVTLLVIPAPELHPFDSRGPELAAWLHERVGAGDAVAQHGFQHLRTRRAQAPRRWLAELQGGEAAEFPGLSASATLGAIDAGREVLQRAGLHPRGFVAPGYAYTPALRLALAGRFDWWGELLRLRTAGVGAHRRRVVHAPALGLGSSGPLKRSLSPALVRGLAATVPGVLRVDVHPVDLVSSEHTRTLVHVLERPAGRLAVTYDELLA